MFNVLTNPHAGHYDRIWLAGFLLNRFGKNQEEVFEVIRRYNKWTDFNEYTTARQIASVERSMGRAGLGIDVPKMSFEEFLAAYEHVIKRGENE